MTNGLVSGIAALSAPPATSTAATRRHHPPGRSTVEHPGRAAQAGQRRPGSAARAAQAGCHDEQVAPRFPESTKNSVRQRLAARARERWPQITELRMRHRGVFTYVQAITETGTLPLCRLRYVGSAHDWQVAIYRASHDDYAESIFPTGLPFGTCQDALDLACGLYLNDPTAWLDLRPPKN
jgi:hypothetical protein